jgi:N-acetylmuramoyl-L-alanine amidase
LGGYREIDINLSIASLVRENLIAAGFDVDLMVEFDPRLIGYHALALVSIHADSCEYINDQATGFKISVTGLNNYPEQSERLTTCLRIKYAEITGLQFHSGTVTDDMSNYHTFSEIDSGTTAAIIDVGYLNLDQQLLTQHSDLVAEGISDGILCYANKENVSP